jgi:hypothetical protein
MEDRYVYINGPWNDNPKNGYKNRIINIKKEILTVMRMLLKILNQKAFEIRILEKMSSPPRFY